MAPRATSGADLVFTAGPVFTADARRSRTHGVAVKDGLIVAIGEDAVELAADASEVVDLTGRLLVPGFQDAHVHPLWGGLDLLRCNLSEDRDREAYLRRIGDYASGHRDEPWILGGGWAMAAFPGGTPLARDLDEVVSDRPVFLMNRDGHGGWANSCALELAGITASTPDPSDGRIERDSDGNPSGTLHEGATALVTRLLEADPPERMLAALLKGQEYLHSYGVTAWQDAIVATEYGDAGDPAPAYRAAAESGQLLSRVVGALWFDRRRGVEQVPDLVERRRILSYDRFSASTVKIMQDGVPENFTAAMLEPYCGHDHGDGLSFVPPQVLTAAVPALDAAGFQVHFHAIGDRAVRECLDAVEAAIDQNGRNDNRHHIAHLQVIHPDDINRFAQLQTAANMQSLWAMYDQQMVELTIPFLGPDRARLQYPFRDLQTAGAVLVAGSDWSVSTPNPWAAIHVAVNRLPSPTEEDGTFEAFIPEQHLDLASSLAAYTSGSAWINHLDEVSGTISVGKEADLVVVDRDPFAAPMDEIGHTQVQQTFIKGQRVYASDDA